MRQGLSRCQQAAEATDLPSLMDLRTGSADSLRVQAHPGRVVRIVAQLATVVAYDGAHDPLI